MNDSRVFFSLLSHLLLLQNIKHWPRLQQAQLYYAGKLRYIGIFDSQEKAALAYKISWEVLKADKSLETATLEEADTNVNMARKAAFAGVNEQDPRTTSCQIMSL